MTIKLSLYHDIKTIYKIMMFIEKKNHIIKTYIKNNKFNILVKNE